MLVTQQLVNSVDRELGLAAQVEVPLDTVFDHLVEKFDLPGSELEASLGCKCPYGLLGCLEAILNDDFDD
jgi:hypothetical protein